MAVDLKRLTPKQLDDLVQQIEAHNQTWKCSPNA